MSLCLLHLDNVLLAKWFMRVWRLNNSNLLGFMIMIVIELGLRELLFSMIILIYEDIEVC